MIDGDAVYVTTTVDVEPEVAFELFTVETDLWWSKGPRFRPLSHPQGQIVFEPEVGGRLLERVEGEAAPAFVLGRVEVWAPPERLVFSMGGRDFIAQGQTNPDDWPVVEITFEREGSGTRIRLEHRGFAALAADHPVRHGLDGQAFLDVMRVFWADLLARAQRHARPKAMTRSDS